MEKQPMGMAGKIASLLRKGKTLDLNWPCGKSVQAYP
jgi:hypothetical protein